MQVQFSPNKSERSISSYGLSKKKGEELLENLLTKSNIEFCSLRLPQLIDDFGECIKHQPWFGRLIRYASSNKILRIPPEGKEEIFYHIIDAAKIMYLAMENDLKGIHSIFHPEKLFYKDIFAKAVNIFDSNAQIEIAREKEEFEAGEIEDSKHIYDLFSWTPEYDMNQVLEKIKINNTFNKFGPFDVK